MDIFEEAEMELGLEPGELEGTFPSGFVGYVKCGHEDVTPHRKWDSGTWYWTCNDCYETIKNSVITDRMRERRAEDMLERDIVDRNL